MLDKQDGASKVLDSHEPDSKSYQLAEEMDEENERGDSRDLIEKELSKTEAKPAKAHQSMFEKI